MTAPRRQTTAGGSAHAGFLREALRLARRSAACDEVPVGAVIVRAGEIIARGRNRREAARSALGHAELDALARASRRLGSWRLDGCIVYVTLEPCAMCAGALQQARVRHVYYGAPDPKAGVVSLGLRIHDNPRLNHRYAMTCLETPACGEILSFYFRAKRR